MRGPAPDPGARRGIGAGTRLLMAAVGATLFVVYGALAAGSYLLIASFLRGLTRSELLTTAVLVVGLTLAFVRVPAG